MVFSMLLARLVNLKLQQTLAVSKASVGFFFSSETVDYPVATLLGAVESSRSRNGHTFKRKFREAFCLSLYTEIFRLPISNNNRSILVIKCEERNLAFENLK